MKPESKLFKQFFGILLISQIFNFDLLSMSICGLLGTTSSIMTNMVPLSFMPDVIASRDVSGINFPLTAVNIFNLTIWLSYAMIKGDPFMTVSQFLGLCFNTTTLMFYFWAKGKINSVSTPNLWMIMRLMINFFRLFEVQQNLKEFNNFFWQDESS